MGLHGLLHDSFTFFFFCPNYAALFSFFPAAQWRKHYKVSNDADNNRHCEESRQYITPHATPQMFISFFRSFPASSGQGCTDAAES
jgi:hypothetical protein